MIFRTMKNSLRLSVILVTLLRHNALFFWRGERSFSAGIRLAASLKALGPTFVKLGQLLSTRSDLIGQEIALALSGLQDRVQPFPAPKVRLIIEEQLGKPVEELFVSFDDRAAAAASIAQVHYATLADGSEAAVKVLRPGVEQAFARDVALLYWLADVAEWWMPSLKRFKLREVTYNFEEMIRFELDLRFEAAAAVELRASLKGGNDMYVPGIYWTLTGQRVLTLERIKGIPISNAAALHEAGYDPARLVDMAAVSFFNQVFRHGFFHADMHPGNMFVMENGRIAIVDFGIMGRIDRKSRIYLAQILHGFLTEDYHNLAQVHFDAGFVPPHKSVDSFALAMMAITKPIIGRKLSDISVARLLGQLFTTAEAFEMEAQPHLLLLQKNMMLIEGVGRMLNPDVNMWQVVQPLIEDWARENLGARAKIKEGFKNAAELAHTLPSLVSRAETVLARISETSLTTQFGNRKAKLHKDWLLFAWAALAFAAFVFFSRF